MSGCRDNDLADGANGGGDDSSADVFTEKQAKKYDALQSLLGVVAEIDSLPDNWDAQNFAIDPKLGEVADAAHPYVRYVVTTSAEEANRIYRSMTSSEVEAKATNDVWQMEDVGTLTFKVQNEPACYATLDVDVQQLPHLQQLRFVPASAVGDNSAPKETPFYQVGDVICQHLDGQNNDTYWVCVRPCSKAAKASKSHWCTLQLTPYGASDANYVKLTKSKCGDLYLPTALCKSQGDGERMVQNYFNVLRVMQNPDLYYKNTVTGIGEITKQSGELTPEKVQNLSYMWSDLGILDKLANAEVVTNLRNELAKENPRLNAFYYGYSKVLFGKGDYRVYNLELSNNNEKDENEQLPENSGLFNEAKKQTLWLEFGDNEKNFNVFEKSAGDNHIVLYEGNESRNCGEQQYIVKYKTGAQLEKNLVYTTDNTPGQSFEERGNNYGLTDVLSYTRLSEKTVKEAGDLPFFAFGDIVAEEDGTSNFCIKDAFGDAQDKDAAYFLRKVNQGGDKCGTKITKEQAIYFTFQLLNAFYYNETKKPIVDLKDNSALYREMLEKLYGLFEKSKAVSYKKDSKGRYFMDVRFYTDPTNLVLNAMLHPTHVKLRYDLKENKIYYFTYSFENIDEKDFLQVNAYKDDHIYTESLSGGQRTLGSMGKVRRELKQNFFSTINEEFQKMLVSED